MSGAYYKVDGQKVPASQATASQRLRAISQMKSAQGNWNMQTVNAGISSYAKSEGIRYSSSGGSGGSSGGNAPSQTPVKTSTVKPTGGGGGGQQNIQSTANITPTTTSIIRGTTTKTNITPTLVKTDYTYSGGRYTSATMPAGIQAGTFAATKKAESVKGNEEAFNLAKTYAESSGKPYKIFRADEYIPPEWTAERVVSGITTTNVKDTKKTGDTTYIYTESRGQVLQDGKLIKNITPEGKGVTTKVVVTSDEYKVYEGNVLIDSGKANKDIGEHYVLSDAQKSLREAGYNVTTENGKIVGTYTEQPKYDLAATEAKAKEAGLNVRREGDQVIVTAPITTTTTTFSRAPTGRGLDTDKLIIARPSTATEKWIKKGEEYTAAGAKTLESVPVVGDYFKGAERLQTQAYADIDASIKRTAKGNKTIEAALNIVGGAPLKAGVNLVFLPANVVKGVSSTGSKTFTIAEAALTNPKEFAEWTGTSIQATPKAGQWIAEHPVEVAGTAVTIGVTALAMGYASKDAAGSLYYPKTVTQTNANIIGTQKGVTYADIYTQAKAPTLFGDVTVKATGGSEIFGTPEGYYIGHAQYTMQQNVPTLTGSTSTTFGANQLSTGMGVDVTKYSYIQVEPSKYGMVSYPVEITKLTAPSPTATTFYGYSKTATQMGTESIAKTYAKEFFKSDTSTVYKTIAKGVTKGNKPFISSGVLTVTDAATTQTAPLIITPTTTTTTTSGGNLFNQLFGTKVKVTGASGAGGVASVTQAIEAEAARQATTTAIVETTKQAGTLGTGAGAYASAITQDVKRQSTSYSDVLNEDAVLTGSTTAPLIQITKPKTKKEYKQQPIMEPQIKPSSVATATDEILITRPKAMQALTPFTTEQEMTGTATAEIDLTKQQQVTLQTDLTTDIKVPTTFTPPVGYGQPFIPPFIPIPSIPELGGGGYGSSGGLSILGRQAKGYQPSVIANIFNIKAPKEPKGVFTGAEIRPIIEPPKRRRKK